MELGSVMFLLGAGSSVDAGLPMAYKMNQLAEEMLADEAELLELYFFLKSSILYQKGLEGNFDDPVGIEELLGVIEELNQKHHNKLYPFVGAWNTHLYKVAGSDFENLSLLDSKIRSQLVSWVKPPNNYRDGSYFNGFGDFVRDYGYSIPIFTLNYDLLVERNLGKNFTIETGFDPNDGKWYSSRFEPNENESKEFYLYKLHGSIDWERDKGAADDFLYCREDPCEKPELIFGVNYKLNSGDPYLFYTHELRRHTLEPSTRLIYVVGYSFSDDYINKLLSQAVKRDPRKRIVNVSPSASKYTEKYLKKLKLADTPESIVSLDLTAKQFLVDTLSVQLCEEHIFKDGEIPF